MLHRFSKFKKGFSIIELIITISIMVIMMAALFAGYGNNKPQNDLEVAARQVKAELVALQNESLSGKQIGTKPVCDFKFEAVANESSYTLSYYTYAAGQRECAAPVAHVLAGGAKIIGLNPSKKVKVVIGATVDVSFVTPWGRTSTGPYSQIILTSTIDSTKQASVCVCASGYIYEQNNVLSCVC